MPFVTAAVDDNWEVVEEEEEEEDEEDEEVVEDAVVEGVPFDVDKRLSFKLAADELGDVDLDLLS